MIEKIFSYTALVLFNSYFIVGLIAGALAKYQFGGKTISFATGLIIGMFIFDLVKHWSFK